MERRSNVRLPKTTWHLENLEKMVRGEVPGPPIAEPRRGGACRDGDGRQPAVPNPMGTMHGGVICDLADAAMGFAMSSTLEDDETFTTLDLTANFFKPVWNNHLHASATVTRRTRSLGFIECEVTDESNSLVAKSFSTCMVLRGEEAKGR